MGQDQEYKAQMAEIAELADALADDKTELAFVELDDNGGMSLAVMLPEEES